ncbi:hypothetical protein QJS10_CPA05g01581 [Acorus calamus]|uniref:NAD(P)-binding domain-containing protein n=1 Tax=Acorus calamus TaxID=4465 RepID=A0AAV9EQW9_ACOCL|nr:hypothetical protein QJS10_CPA05g01581 [Acorus calamus]
MKLFSLQSPTITCLPSSSRRVLIEKSAFFYGQPLISGHNKRCPVYRKHRFFSSRAPTSGSSMSTTISSLSATGEAKQETSAKDCDLVYVAGATGRVGSRTVRELLKLGLRVRAGVRSVPRAVSLVQSVQQMKLDDADDRTSKIQPVERLEIVECDLEKPETIGPALGNSAVVICCIGASEKEVFDVTGPYRIDYKATENLIKAATSARVDHFILVTSLGTNKIGFPAAILNLFWGVLTWKRKAEEALISSVLPYTIVRPGGMERPTDAFKDTHNMVLANEDTLFGGLVSNLQVAELLAFIAKNKDLSYCKVVEVIAETTAPLTPMGELLSKIASKRAYTSTTKESPSEQKPELEATKITSGVSEKTNQTEVKKTTPLSPYIVYADLKPPTSPTPTPSTTPSGTKDVNAVETETEKIQPSTVTKTSPLSPYVVYEDFKPPTTPSPNTPVTVHASDSQMPSKDITTEKVKQQNQRPLSPFTMYEELKPPSSPMPSSRK